MQTEQSVMEKAKARLAERDRVKADGLLQGAATLTEAVQRYERNLIAEAMRLANGKLPAAAKLLGISRQALAYIIDGRQKDANLRHKSKVLRPRRNQSKGISS